MVRVASLSAVNLVVIFLQVTFAQNSKLSGGYSSDECNLYLAKSSIPDAGFGVFTTVKIPKGAQIYPENQGTAIIVTDLITHHTSTTKYPRWMSDYQWSQTDELYRESDTDKLLMPQLGMMLNSYPGQNNVDHDEDNVMYNDTMASRFKHPGAGAFSYRRTYQFLAKRDIEAGDELFISYGRDYTMEEEDMKVEKITSKHYDKATEIVKKLGEASLNDSFLEKIAEIVESYDPKTASILPKTMEKYWEYTRHPESSSIRQQIELSFPSSQSRNIDWIKENGLCLDNLICKTSTLGSEVGYGAFAQRAIPEGGLVVPMPVKQILDKSVLDTFIIKLVDFGEKLRSGRVPIGSQLLTNYCFGHERSSILLCPTTNAQLINHCSNRMNFGGTCDERGPNAKIVWSTGWYPNSDKWRKYSWDKLKEESAKGLGSLSFDVVATRRIEPDEEVFIDYGIAWENAWKEHVSSWHPPEPNSIYSSFGSVIEHTERKDLRTVVEELATPYPKNIYTACAYFHGQPDISLPSNWKELSDEDILQNYSIPYSKFRLATGGLQMDKTCRILFREDNASDVHGGLTYTVLFSPYEEEEQLIVSGYPEQYIKLNIKLYSSDQHLPNAFRSPIGIPDELFPIEWENI